MPHCRRSAAAASLAAVLLAVSACRRPSTPPAASPGAGEPADWFVDRAAEAGLAFTHFNGMSGALYYAEHMGPGVALFDYDNDGDLDVFIPQGRMLGGRGLDQAVFPPPSPSLEGRLFRNDLQVKPDGTRVLRFTDVTRASRIDAHGYGMGAAAGDYNNDGCIDLYVTALGRNQLFRNNCDGTFTDVSEASGTADSGWSVSAAFVDYDRDGWLDLFVGHYLAYSPETNVKCYSVSGRPDYCPPHVYAAEPSRLYHNNRDGTFTDVTAAAGLSREFGPALGVSTADFNGDGWIDLYVANDGQPNQLWINQHDGTFRNTALLAGTALSAEGAAKSSMGVDAGDYDNDGDEDLFVAELTGQGADLYANDGTGSFVDESARSGVRFLTLPYTGFGAAWIDVDNDGWLDLFMVNGTVTALEELVKAGDPLPLRQRKLLLRNLGNGRFEDATERAGRWLLKPAVGRGAAFGDLDNDGSVDIVVANNAGPVELLMNQIGRRNHWVGIRVVSAAAQPAVRPAGSPGARSSPNGGSGVRPRDAVGARVAIVLDDGRTIWRRARADGSYGSANDPRVVVGLGRAARVSHVRVVWPDGRSEQFGGVPVDRYTTLTEHVDDR